MQNAIYRDHTRLHAADCNGSRLCDRKDKKMKYIIECEVESSEVIQTLHIAVNNEKLISYTTTVIDAILKNLAIADIIESYRIHRADDMNLLKNGYRLEPTASFQLDPEILEAYLYYDIQMYYNPFTNHYAIGACDTGEFIQDAGCTQEEASEALTKYCKALLDAGKAKNYETYN